MKSTPEQYVTYDYPIEHKYDSELASVIKKMARNFGLTGVKGVREKIQNWEDFVKGGLVDFVEICSVLLS